ncbi:alpha/beta fold hydrolase [Streptomyces hirsutus]|uniref:alpha/beta fold hydrolase n=1 Tax=Streptomyces hirsutus TaxID=35620 RepID=UPI00342B1976
MRPEPRAASLALTLLSHDWAGLPLALVPAAAGTCCLVRGRGPVSFLPGGALLAVGGLLGAGSLRHLRRIARISKRYPPPGQLVDVGGHRMHVLAEGERAGMPTVVWMPGGHVGGYAMYHLHALMRGEARSVLVDRPGTGWSGPGPFPRTTAREAEELLTVLEAAGEEGPFVFVGHSFGGLLVANAARRRPDRLAGVVLLDPTPPHVIAFGPPLPELRKASAGQLRRALWELFGLRREDHGGPAPEGAASGGWSEPERVLAAVETRTRAGCAAASIFRELPPLGLSAAGWQTVIHDGDLDGLPLVVVAPRDLTGAEDSLRGAGSHDEQSRIRRFYLTARDHYLTASSRARRIHAPEGTGHTFPDEVPEFVVEVVRSVLRQPTTGPVRGDGPDLENRSR